VAATYEIKLPQFQGPFDLLLFFIERDELDIYDIPLARITDDFLDYIHRMRAMNIDIASEFMLVASKLMHIKAKTLLPARQSQEEGEEEDPRQELIERLVEYKKYKNVVSDLQILENERQKQYKRGNTHHELEQVAEEFATETELHSLSLYKLLTTFQSLMDRFEKREQQPEHRVVQHSYTIKGEKDRLLKLMKSQTKADFHTVLQNCDNKMQAIFSFLAILELIQQQVVIMEMGEDSNHIHLFVHQAAA